uniref:Organ specific protein n=1 Tax=Strongyloides papillosus TaxID=174720 RepID=A0A0N5B490_STREA
MVYFQLITLIFLSLAISLSESKTIGKRDTDDFFIDRSPKWYKDPIKASIIKNSPKRHVHSTSRFARSTDDLNKSPKIMVPFDEGDMDVGTAPPEIVPFEEPSNEFFKQISQSANNKINNDHFGSKNRNPDTLMKIDFEGPLLKKYLS